MFVFISLQWATQVCCCVLAYLVGCFRPDDALEGVEGLSDLCYLCRLNYNAKKITIVL